MIRVIYDSCHIRFNVALCSAVMPCIALLRSAPSRAVLACFAACRVASYYFEAHHGCTSFFSLMNTYISALDGALLCFVYT